MCGRSVKLTVKQIEMMFGAKRLNYTSDREFPSQMGTGADVAAVVNSKQNDRFVVAHRWGMPLWDKLLVNARSETVLEKPVFAEAARLRRGILPVSCFFEQVWAITGADGPLALATIWNYNPDTFGHHDCVVLTGEADQVMAKIHHRMPIVLPKEIWGHWLDRKVTSPSEVRDMMVPTSSSVLKWTLAG